MFHNTPRSGDHTLSQRGSLLQPQRLTTGPRHNLTVGNRVRPDIGNPLVQRFGKPPKSANKSLHLKHRVVLNHRPTMSAGQISHMSENHRDVGQVFPCEQVLISSHRSLNEPVGKFGFRCGAMLVNHAARGREKTFPPSFPGLVRHICILEIERMVKRIESAERYELLAIYSARSPTRPEYGHGLELLVLRSHFLMPEIKEAIVEPSTGFPRFFTSPGCIREEDLGGDGED